MDFWQEMMNKGVKKELVSRGYAKEIYKVTNCKNCTDDELIRFCGGAFGGEVYRSSDDVATVETYID